MDFFDTNRYLLLNPTCLRENHLVVLALKLGPNLSRIGFFFMSWWRMNESENSIKISSFSLNSHGKAVKAILSSSAAIGFSRFQKPSTSGLRKLENKCFTESRNRCLRSAFIKYGLRSTTTDLKDGGSIMHCWVPKTRDECRPNLLLIHGFGSNALWQWGNAIRHFIPYFNVYVPDLIFFGDSITTRPERTDSFQAECIMRVMAANSVRKLSLVGLSYGGFVGYCLAAQYREVVEKVVICSAGVCMEEKDLREGLFRVSDLEEAAKILVPQEPKKLKELVSFALFRPPPVGLLPSCFLSDFIHAMCTEYVEERKDLIKAIPKGRKLSDIPKIEQPTLIIWGEHDKVFPLEMGHRLKRHLGESSRLVVIKNAGHAFNLEKPKEFLEHLKSFLLKPDMK